MSEKNGRTKPAKQQPEFPDSTAGLCRLVATEAAALAVLIDQGEDGELDRLACITLTDVRHRLRRVREKFVGEGGGDMG